MKPRCNYQIGLSLVALRGHTQGIMSLNLISEPGNAGQAGPEGLRKGLEAISCASLSAAGPAPCSCPSPAISIPTSQQSTRPRPRRPNRTHSLSTCSAASSTFPPFAPSRIAWLNQAILAIPPFPCANPAQHARPRRDAHSDPCLPPNACPPAASPTQHTHLPG